MRNVSLCLLLLLTTTTPLHAEELSIPEPPGELLTAQIESLQAQLAQSEQQRTSLLQEAEERGSAQINRLRQDNQRLKLQIKQLQASQPQPLPQPQSWLSEQQRWFTVGAGVTLASLLIGRLSAGRSRRRSEWI